MVRGLLLANLGGLVASPVNVLRTCASWQVTPGADSSKKESPETVADYTLKLLRRRVPPAVPGMPPARPSLCY